MTVSPMESRADVLLVGTNVLRHDNDVLDSIDVNAVRYG